MDASGFFFFTTLKRAEELTLMELKRLRKRVNGGRGGPRTGPRNALKRKKNAFFLYFLFLDDRFVIDSSDAPKKNEKKTSVRPKSFSSGR